MSSGGALPGIFDETIFSSPSFGPNLRKRREVESSFIRPMHPKTEIRPKREAIEKILNLGWVGQLKVHGHRAQIHLSSDPHRDPIVYNRQGKPHQKSLTPAMVAELRRIFMPQSGWTVLDAEWLKSQEKIFVFDLLRSEGKTLNQMTYQDRYPLIPRAYISPHFLTLPLLETLEKCIDALQSSESWIEGIVLKSISTPGFEDTSVIRCLKSKSA